VAVGGEAGVAQALAIYRSEIDRVMAYLGCRSVADIGPHLIHDAPGATSHAPADPCPTHRMTESPR
jgi:isopentenyl diphosphate isomerase/L-lactate dehydrogenase-like FMN-dependent dehydrogenase